MTRRERITLWRWGFLVMVALAAVLGFFGFLAQRGWQLTWEDLHAAALNTMQIFVLNLGAEDIKNGATRVASLLAPVATAGVILLEFVERIARRVRFWHLSCSPADEIFLGCGNTAAAVVAQRCGALSQSDQRVVGLDCATDTPFERAFLKVNGENSAASRAPRVSIFRGDALSSDDLNAINAANCNRVWVLTGDDMRNVEIVQRLLDLRKAKAKSPCAMQRLLGVLKAKMKPPAADKTADEPPVIVLSIYDPMLARAIQGEWDSRPCSARVEVFNLPRFAARILLRRFPPDYPKLSTDMSTSQGRLHLCIIGESDFAPALLVHAAMHCVYSEIPADCVHLTWIGVGVSARLQQLYLRYPALNSANVDQFTVPGDPNLAKLLPLATITALDADPSQITPGQWLQLQEGRPFAKIYMVADNDRATKIAARRALALHDVCAGESGPAADIVACLNDRLAEVRSESGELPPAIKAFNIFAELVHPGERYPGEQRDKLAQAVDLHYRVADVDHITAHEEANAKVIWEGGTDDFRWSSRFSADHIDVKLAILGLNRDSVRVHASAGGAGARSPLTDTLDQEASTQVLMRIEHRRFIAERLVEGWLPLAKDLQAAGAWPPSGLRYADKDQSFTQKVSLRLNTTLVPFHLLDPGAKHLDEKLVGLVRKRWLELAGQPDPGQT